jgi:hypothetical protein
MPLGGFSPFLLRSLRKSRILATSERKKCASPSLKLYLSLARVSPLHVLRHTGELSQDNDNITGWF